MESFYKHCAKIMLICVVLFLSFLITTIAFDALARATGYYEEGIQDSESLRMGQ